LAPGFCVLADPLAGFKAWASGKGKEGREGERRRGGREDGHPQF